MGAKIKAFLADLGGNVLATGVTSLFTDFSSEMTTPILPIFLQSVLGAPAWAIGLIEGGAQAVANIAGFFSGRWSDSLGKRKPFMVLGYTASNVLKIFFAFTGSWGQVLALRWLERVGKGIRGAPRDALLAASVPADRWGKAFGLHRSMDTLGAALGPLTAALLLFLFRDNLRVVFLWTAIPGILSVLALIIWVREPTAQAGSVRANPKKVVLSGLPMGFKSFLLVSGLFALGNSADAFIILRARELGLPLLAVPLAYLAFNLVYAFFSLPAGILADRYGKRKVLFVGFSIFALSYLGLGLIKNLWEIWPLLLFYGLYYAATDGVGKAIISGMVAKTDRGSAQGTYGLVTGLAALPASLLAGFLWDRFGPGVPFLYGAGMTALTLVVMLFFWKRLTGRDSYPSEGAVNAEVG